MKRYLLKETRTIYTFKDKKEAEQNRDNMNLFYPDNDYKVMEVKDE